MNSLYKHFNKLKESWNNDKPVIHLDSFLSVREAVKANIGLAVLPRVIIKEELKTDLITILPYKDNIFENFSLKIIGAARKDKNISYMHEALRNYIIQSMKL